MLCDTNINLFTYPQLHPQIRRIFFLHLFFPLFPTFMSVHLLSDSKRCFHFYSSFNFELISSMFHVPAVSRISWISYSFPPNHFSEIHLNNFVRLFIHCLPLSLLPFCMSRESKIPQASFPGYVS